MYVSPILQHYTGRSLTRQFALLSFVVIGVITLALCLVIAASLRKDMLQREWRITADYVRSEALEHLTLHDFLRPESPTAHAHFETFRGKTVGVGEIFRVKIYDAAMTVIWSDQPFLIGHRFADNPHLQHALTGNVTVNLEIAERKSEHIYEGREFPELVELYVPIRLPGVDHVVGVIETYKAPAEVFANIRRGQLVVVGTALAGSGLLYVSLFWIVRRAAWRIDAQHAALQRHSQELTAANEELQAVQSQLVAAERMAAIGEVVAAVAHGIRNPLANIRAAAQVAMLEYEDGSGHTLVVRNLGNIMAEVDRLEGRLRELLQFVRPAERQSQRLDLNLVVCNVRQMMAERLERGGLRVEEHLATGLPPVLGDAILFEEVLLSLLGNAIDAVSARGGTITLSTGTARDATGASGVFMEVQDTGVGIAVEDVANIFQPFYTTKTRGTGLGLAIAKKFTEAYGGTITVYSRPDVGSTFRVTFPAHGET